MAAERLREAEESGDEKAIDLAGMFRLELRERLRMTNAIRRQVFATERFIDDLKEFEKAYPSLSETFIDFVKQKTTSNDLFGRKDGPSLGPLKGFNHAHLVFGKVIMFYRLSEKGLYLAHVDDHAAIDGHNERGRNLGRQLQGLTSADYRLLTLPQLQELTLTSDERAKIKDFLWSLVDDRPALERIARGDLDEILTFAPDFVPGAKTHADAQAILLRSFTGETTLPKLAKDILAKTKVQESILREALRSLLEGYSLPPSLDIHNPRKVDPALLTTQEYLKIVDPDEKWHPSEAYDWSLEKMNYRPDLIKDYPVLINNLTVRGLKFQLRAQRTKLTYNRWDDEAQNYLRGPDNQLMVIPDDEVAAAGKPLHEVSVGLFNDKGQMVGTVQDEWGAVLIAVAREYRGFGFGQLLGRVARTLTPTKGSGGFTPGGRANFMKVHRETIRDALASGKYRDLIRKGQITLDRVKEILASANLKQRPTPQSSVNLDTSDPRNWLVYGEYGAFIVYDKKLREIHEDHPEWEETCIKGYALVRIIHHWSKGGAESGILVHFGGDTPQIKKTLLALCASHCAEEGVDFAVDPDDMPLIDPAQYEIGETDMKTGYKRTHVTIKRPLDTHLLTELDRRFRRGFDRYGEFKNMVIELAEAKFRKVRESVSESVDDDISASEAATKAWTTLTNHLHGKTERLPVMVINGEEHPFVFAHEAGLPHDDLAVMFSRTSPSGALLTLQKPSHGIRHVIILKGDVRTPKDAQAALWKGQETFTHEFIHYLDTKRYRAYTPDQSGDVDKAAYYNSPEEFNAFFHNIARDLLDHLKMVRSDGKDHAEEWHPIEPDFRNYLKRTVKNLPARYKAAYQNFDETFKAKLVRRLAKLHAEAVGANSRLAA